MLNAMRCPHCGGLLETDQPIGQAIPCPRCEKFFTVEPEFMVRSSGMKERLIQIAIPLGYVCFVFVPMLLTIRFLMNQAEEQAQKEKEQPTEVVVATPSEREAKKPPPPVIPKPIRKPPIKPGPAAFPTDEGDDPKPPDPKTPEPKPPDPEIPKAVEVTLAPPPRELPEIHIAPEPHPILWKFPLLGYSSTWQKVGAVELRISGIAITKVPFVDSKEKVTESIQPMFVVLVEVRLNMPMKKRELRSWTYGIEHYGVIYLEGGKELAPGKRPVGTKINNGLDFPLPLPADGTPVRDVLLFAIPPDGTGELSLRLDGDRCGESGDLWFKIPASALKK